jgi:hypothetical protein
MNKSLVTELFFTVVLTALIFLLFNPAHVWMPMFIHIAAIGVLLLVFTILSFIVLTHLGEDEREQRLRLSSYQVSYVLTCAVLTTAVVVQSFQHNVDVWIIVSLIVMLTSKYISLLISHLRS